jgi:phosphatidate cytidylyltransferase
MKNRVYTSIVFVIVMLGGVYISPVTFVLLFGSIAGLCLWEFLQMVLPNERKRDHVRKHMGMVLGLAPFSALAILHIGFESVDLSAKWLLFFFPMVFLVLVYELFTRSEHPVRNIAYIILGIIYIGVPFSLLQMVAFDTNAYRPNVICGMLLLTWCNDTAAYLFGSRIGKTPLFPSISPKKTWEGTLAGVCCTLLAAVGLSFMFADLTCLNWAIISAIISVFGTLGDLVESMLKRSVQVKDSGTLLPGHGGLLDRFDSFLFTLPFVAIYVLFT